MSQVNENTDSNEITEEDIPQNPLLVAVDALQEIYNSRADNTLNQNPHRAKQALDKIKEIHG